MADYEPPRSYEEALLRVNALQYSLASLKDENRQLSEENAALDRAAHTDEQTGLLNRAGYERAIRQALATLEPGATLTYTFAYGDVGGLKWINDRLGHTFGDTLLLLVVLLIQRSIKAADIVARLGGDEIGICVRGPSSGASTMLNRISDLLFTFTAGIVQIHFGLASSEASTWAEVKTIERQAEERMYVVKADSKRLNTRLCRWWRGISWLTRVSYEQFWSR